MKNKHCLGNCISLIAASAGEQRPILDIIPICPIFVCQDDFEHVYVRAGVSSLVIIMRIRTYAHVACVSCRARPLYRKLLKARSR